MYRNNSINFERRLIENYRNGTLVFINNMNLETIGGKSTTSYLCS
nr:MAG TPA: hypothetical protein [Bacteriophage sp.]